MAEICIVEQGSWQSLEGKGELITGGIQTGIGISIYSPNEARAILGHFGTDRPSEKSFNEMRLKAHRWMSYLEGSRIWVGGAQVIDSISDDPYFGYTSQEEIDRANQETYTLKLIVLDSISHFIAAGAKFSNKSMWLENINTTIGYSLDVETGEELVLATSDNL